VPPFLQGVLAHGFTGPAAAGSNNTNVSVLPHPLIEEIAGVFLHRSREPKTCQKKLQFSS